MSSIPKFQVFTKRKLEDDPKPSSKKRKYNRLGYRTFREMELKQLNDVLDKNNIELQGNYALFVVAQSITAEFCVILGHPPRDCSEFLFNILHIKI